MAIIGLSLLRLLLAQLLQIDPLGEVASLAQVGVVFTICGISFYFARQGQLQQAVYTAVAALDTFFIWAMFTGLGSSWVIPYLLLTTTILLTVILSNRIGILHFLFTLLIVTIHALTSPAYDGLQLFAFLATSLLIGASVWSNNRHLQSIIQQTQASEQALQQATQQTQKYANTLQQNLRIIQNSAMLPEPEQMMQVVTEQICQFMGFDHAAILLLDPSGERLILHALAGIAQGKLQPLTDSVVVDEHSIIGWTAVHRQAHMSNNIREDTVYLETPALAHIQSEIALPLIIRDQLIGVMDIQSHQLLAFSAEDVTLLQIFANQIAVQLENSRLLSQMTATLEETKILFNFIQFLSSTLDIGELYRRTVRSFDSELHTSRCEVHSWEINSAETVTQTVLNHVNAPSPLAGISQPMSHLSLPHSSHTWAVLTANSTALYTHDSPDLLPHEQTLFTENNAAYCLEVPLVHGGETQGFVRLLRNAQQKAFTPSEVRLAEIMAHQTAVALHNAKLATEAQGRVAQLSIILRMNELLSHATSLKTIFEGARDEILSLISATGMSLSLITKDGSHLNWIYGFEFGHEVDLSNIPPLPITQGFSGYVARNKKLLYIDKRDESMRRELQSMVVGADVVTWLGLPMLVSGHLIGVIAVESNESFSKYEIEVLQAIVGPIASAIYNFLQLDELQTLLLAQSEQRLQLQTAAEVAAAAASVLQPDKLMEEAVNLIQQRFSLYYVGLYIINEETNEAILRAGTGRAGALQVQENRRLTIGGRSLVGGVTRDGQPRITQNVTEDDEWLPNPFLPETRSESVLPLRVRGQMIGALTVQSKTPNMFNPELIRILQTMSDQLAIAIDNARLLRRVEARAQRQQSINQISTQLHQTADVEEIVHIGLRALADQLNLTDLSLYLGKEPTPAKLENGRTPNPIEEIS